MKATLVVLSVAVMLPCVGIAQDVKFEFGATLNAVLADTVDARKNKSGDAVKAKASEDLKVGGQIVIPRGARLVGHVTEAQPATGSDTQARLGLVFDRADLKDGRQIPLHATFYALAAPAGAANDSGSTGGGFGGAFGAGSAAVGNMVNASSRTPSDETSALGTSGARHEDLKPSSGAIGGLNTSGTLYASSRGVFGLEQISLEPNAVPSNGSSVVLANARSVRLVSGTRMLLSVESPVKP